MMIRFSWDKCEYMCSHFITKKSKFEEEIRKLIGGSIDTSELDREYDGLNFRYI